ncbi:MAG: lamin tail domain-containing protein [bacterium]|nr:lamin tail domain-containing protein [bacterium]
MYKILAMGLVVAGAFAPMTTSAAVVINEIAWMGTSVDNGSFCEWVELANDGLESVSLSGWTLKTLDGGMTVTLSGSIDAGGFYLIERSTPTACPDPVPGIDADLARSFGGGLSNAGEILVLMNGATEVDRIDASGGWEGVVGGDSALKYTAQRNGSSWVTAVATPRAVNATESVITPSTTSSGSTPSTKKVIGNPVPTLYIETGGDRIVSTKTHTKYQPIVYDSTGRHVKYPYVTWAFGDGGRHIGTDVEHVYREPGEYLVVVRAQESYSHGTASFVVIADPADISITHLSEKGVTLKNSDTRILDLSRYQLVSGRERFKIPEDTQILPGRTVIFPPEVTGLSTSTLSMELRYPSGEVAFVYPPAISTPTLLPVEPGTGSTILRAVEIPARKEVPTHAPTIVVPAQTVEPVRAGARSAFQALFAPFLRLASL